MIDFFGETEAHAGDKAVLACLIAFGVFEVFFGLRFFRSTLFLMSAAVTFVVLTSVVGDHVDNDNEVYAISGFCALVAGILAAAHVRTGISLLGAALGGGAAYMAYITFFQHSDVPKNAFYGIISVAALIGAVIGFKGYRFIVILSTTLGGSFVVIRSIDMLHHNEISVDTIKHQALSSEGWGLLVGFVVLAVVGMFVQFRSGHKVPDYKNRVTVKDGKTDRLIDNKQEPTTRGGRSWSSPGVDAV